MTATLGPAGVIGATGPRSGARVRALAARIDATAVGDGALTLLAPGERLTTARRGAVAGWLAGTLDPGGSLEAVCDTLTGEAHGGAPAPPGHHLLVASHEPSQTRWVLRDPLGARTLHWALAGGEAVFAEHLADLLMLLPATPAIDRGAVVMWIATRALPPGRTPFLGVARLSAGEALRIDAAGPEPVRSWQPRYREPAPLPPAAVADIVTTAALDAVVRAASGADRPGVRLSGGLDSACVAAGLAAATPGRALALTRTFPGYPMTDESELIEQTAAMAGLELVTLPYEETALPEPMRAYAERWALPAPSPNLAIHPPLLLAARARSVDRLLDGEGGDEMFGIWPPLIADALWRGEPRAAWDLVSRLPRIGSAPGRRFRLQLLLRHGVRAGLAPPVERTIDRVEVARDAVTGGLVAPRDLPGLLRDTAVDPWAHVAGPRWWRAAVHGLAGRGDLLDAPGTLARTAAAGPVTARHPFMHDVALLETMLAIPPAAGFQGTRDRGPLRDGLAGRIPEAVRGRFAKSYFNEVSARRLDGPDGMALRHGLLAPGAPIREFVRPAGLERAAGTAAVSGLERYRRAAWLFRLAAVNIWLHALGERAPQGSG